MVVVVDLGWELNDSVKMPFLVEDVHTPPHFFTVPPLKNDGKGRSDPFLWVGSPVFRGKLLNLRSVYLIRILWNKFGGNDL